MRSIAFAALLALPEGALPAQELAERITAIDAGTVRVTYPTKEGVCGDGKHLSTGSHQYHGDDTSGGPSL